MGGHTCKCTYRAFIGVRILDLAEILYSRCRSKYSDMSVCKDDGVEFNMSFDLLFEPEVAQTIEPRCQTDDVVHQEHECAVLTTFDVPYVEVISPGCYARVIKP